MCNSTYLKETHVYYWYVVNGRHSMRMANFLRRKFFSFTKPTNKAISFTHTPSRKISKYYRQIWIKTHVQSSSNIPYTASQQYKRRFVLLVSCIDIKCFVIQAISRIFAIFYVNRKEIPPAICVFERWCRNLTISYRAMPCIILICKMQPSKCNKIILTMTFIRWCIQSVVTSTVQPRHTATMCVHTANQKAKKHISHTIHFRSTAIR